MTMEVDLELQQRQINSQPSIISNKTENAVCVRRACKRYGTSSNPHIVLDGLNMTVPKGSIYGLLGASGCGKSTLLSCIVGRKRLNSGELSVLGGHPGSRGSGVPGPRIGYMPQETALYGEFTIRETMKYFGWISNMKTEKVEERLAFLVEFLMLPSADQVVKTLSGGQQRRVSFAAALLHEPELLILDEPTVGVDPVIRQNIWDHLVYLTKSRGTTIIITTHYIDETRQAHLIGLMRGGYFLAEAAPTDLMTQHAADSLEEVFLKLSVFQNQGKPPVSSIAQVIVSSIAAPTGVVNEAAVVDDVPGEASGIFGDNMSTSAHAKHIPIPSEVTSPELPSNVPPPMTWSDYFKVVEPHHMQALVWKNALWMWRNYPVMLFLTVLPIIQMIFFCLSIGHDPIDLSISVVNRELVGNETCAPTTTCNSTRLSCNFLDYLERRTLQLSFYNTLEEANDQVRLGYSWATVSFKHNFSEAIKSRLYNSRTITSEDLASSEVDIYQDISNQNIGTFLKRDLYSAFENFFQDYLESCNISRKFGARPVRFNDPVYGYRNPNFTDFSVPGIILTMVFFLSLALTAGAMLLERNEGILERSLVNGITGVELLFGHVITLFVFMSVQTSLVLIFTFGVFDMTMNGSVPLVVLLLLLTGLCGMCFGFVVSCVCDSERTATYMAMGSFMPIMMLCGIIWPIEAMHHLLQIVAYFLPLTKSTESMRSMLQRGWGFEKPVVYGGFVSTIVWIAIYLTLSILLLKFKKG